MTKEIIEETLSEEPVDVQEVELTELEKLEKEIKDLKASNIRTHADFQNVKKRLEKEKLSAIKNSHEKFSLELLEVLDTLYLAEAHIQDDNEREGITNTILKLESVFKKYHITETLYDIFDPNEHQAIQTIPTETDNGLIVDVLRKGYKIHDKILRPAMVSISGD